MVSDQFVNIKLEISNLDRYHVRSSIFNSIKEECGAFEGQLLDVGCGKMPYKKYILDHSNVESYVGLEIESSLDYKGEEKPDIFWNGIKMPIEDNSYDVVIASEVLEHCPDINIILSEINRVLRPGGKFFFTIPFMWPLHEVPHDEYRYTPFSIQRHLTENSFDKIDLKAHGGWNAAMAQMLGLWVRRSLVGRRRKIISIILKPVIKFLLKKDRIPPVFGESQMITGIRGVAYKTK